MLKKQVYEVEAMQRLSPMSTTEREVEREAFERNLDDALAKCEWFSCGG